ncbi:MAG TPA: class I SAM-dependent methyltransferase [Phycisphaeraceae bacterium]|nr:class I SAM-dependent methyltransferase [Phycisphaeraceae bacterium]
MSFKSALENACAAFLAKVLRPRLLTRPRFFRLWEKRGYHITPVHYYQPLPDTRELPPSLWEKRSEMPGIDLAEKQQVQLLESFARRFRDDYSRLPADASQAGDGFHFDNPNFRQVDAEILYSMIRHFQPRKIIEVGSGFSTLLSARAIREQAASDPEYHCQFTAIDPYPHRVLRRAAQADNPDTVIPGLGRILTAPVEKVPMEEFTTLGENDILFLDSSHVLKIGGDVQYEYLEILPRLPRGVVVHVHDIFFPWEYPRDWVMERNLFWTEQYLLQAFLSLNDSFEILWMSHFMLQEHRPEVENAIPSARGKNVRPGSFWMRRVR